MSDKTAGTRHALRIVLVTLGLGALWSAPGQAQQAFDSIPINILLTAPSLAPGAVPAIAPTGDLVAYPVVDHRRRRSGPGTQPPRSTAPWYALACDILVSSFAGEPPINVTRGEGNNWAPSWSPDGQQLAFLSDRESVPSAGIGLWLWERKSGSLRRIGNLRISTAAGEVAGPKWTADGSVVVKIEIEPRGGTPPELGTAEVTTDTSSIKPTVVLFSNHPTHERPISYVGQSSIEGWLGDLAVVNVRTGEARRITYGQHICNYILSPDRKLVLWAAARGYSRPESQQTLVDLAVSDLATGRSRNLAFAVPSTIPYVLFSWSSTSRLVAYRTTGTETKDEVYVVPATGGTPVRVARGNREPWRMQAPPLWGAGDRHLFFVRDRAVWRAALTGRETAAFASLPGHSLQTIDGGSGALWSPDGGYHSLVFTFDNATKRAGVARVDLLSGGVEQLFEEDKFYSSFFSSAVVTADGKYVVYAAEDPNHPPDLWRTGATGEPRQLTHIAPVLAQWPGGAAQIIEWRGLDGDTLQGALIYPGGYVKGQRYPLIVKVYPGRTFSDDLNRYGYADEAIENIQVFASRGYAVLLADSKAAMGWPMLGLLKSVLPGVDRVIELGVADPGRIGIMGHSYGGYGTLALIVQSRRFKAAMIRGGFSDLISTYTDLRPDGTNYGLPQLESRIIGGSPWEVWDRYVENSPIHYLNRIETPVLIIHGGDDTAVHVTSADEIFVALRRLGKRVDYARYAGEDHSEGLWSMPNQLDYLARAISWFEQYLKGG